MTPTSDWKDLLRPGVHALKENWPPFLLVQAAILILIGCYFGIAEVKHSVQFIADWKSQSGPLGAMCAGAIAGGLIPEIAKFATGRLKASGDWVPKTLYVSLVYGLNAIIVNEFYNGLDRMYHGAGGLSVVIGKTLIDQLLMSTLVFIPFGVTAFEFYSLKFNVKDLKASLSNRFYRRRCMPTMLVNWAFWVPILVGVYAVPLPLQFPVAMLAEAAWSLLMVFINVNMQQEPLIE